MKIPHSDPAAAPSRPARFQPLAPRQKPASGQAAPPGRAAPEPSHSPQPLARSAARVASPETIQRVRRAHDAEGAREVQAHAGSTSAHREHREAQLRERLASELSTSVDVTSREGSQAAMKPEAALPAVEGQNGAPEATPTAEAGDASRAVVEALVERIEAFVRAGRPGLSLTLASGFASEVTVERTGPGEISLRIRARSGPPSASEIARLRAQLAARRLRVRELRVS